MILEEIRRNPELTGDFLQDSLKRYCGLIFMLPEYEVNENITLMAQTCVARALHIPVSKLPGVDHPGQCGGSTAVLSKRIQLFLGVQKGLGIYIDPKVTPNINMIRDLAQIIETALLSRNNERND